MSGELPRSPGPLLQPRIGSRGLFFLTSVTVIHSFESLLIYPVQYTTSLTTKQYIAMKLPQTNPCYPYPSVEILYHYRRLSLSIISSTHLTYPIPNQIPLPNALLPSNSQHSSIPTPKITTIPNHCRALKVGVVGILVALGNAIFLYGDVAFLIPILLFSKISTASRIVSLNAPC